MICFQKISTRILTNHSQKDKIMKLAFDSCVFIKLFPLSKKVENYCLQRGKRFEDLCEIDIPRIVKVDYKLNYICLKLLQGLKFGLLDVSILPTVYHECLDGPNKSKQQEFEKFLNDYKIQKEAFDRGGVFMRDYAFTFYLSTNNKKAVTVDYGGSKHPLNDSKILAESFVAGRQLISTDQHFSKTYLIYERNCEIARHFGLEEERAKIVPLQLTQFAKTRLYKSLKQKGRC